MHTNSLSCYRSLAAGIVDRLAEEIAAGVFEKLGSGFDAAQK
jgi:hypothetical protein